MLLCSAEVGQRCPELQVLRPQQLVLVQRCRRGSCLLLDLQLLALRGVGARRCRLNNDLRVELEEG